MISVCSLVSDINFDYLVKVAPFFFFFFNQGICSHTEFHKSFNCTV